MGMSIDEAIKYFRALKRCKTCEAGKPCSCYRIGTLSRCYDAIDVGIATIRKYQKIEQIFKDIEKCELVEDFALDEIREVLEDGSN